MSRRLVLPTALFVMAVAAYGAVAVHSFTGKAFPGFLVYPVGFVAPYLFEEWAGKSAGLQWYDQLTSCENRPFTSPAALYREIADLPVGTELVCSIRRDGAPVVFSVATSKFHPRDALYLFLLLGLPGLVICLCGLLALRWNRRKGIHAGAVAALCMGIWEISTIEFFLGGRLKWVLYAVFSLFVPTALHYGLAYPAPNTWVSPRLLPMLYVVCPVILSAYWIGLRAPRLYLWADLIMWSLAGVTSLWALVSRVDHFARARSVFDRRRSGVVVAGFGLGACFGIAILVLSYLWQINAFSMMAWGLVPIFVSVAWAEFLSAREVS